MTTLEFAILQAIDASEYGEFLVDVIWTFSLWHNVDQKVVKTQRSIGGIVASLRKKGLVTIGGSGTQDDPQTIGLTEEGICQYLARCAALNLKVRKTVSYEVEQHEEKVDSGKLTAEDFGADDDEPSAYKPEAAVLYTGQPGSGSATIYSKVDPDNTVTSPAASNPDRRTVSAFLKTEEFETAANVSGNTVRSGYSADSDGRVAYEMRGGYTVEEVKAILRDLEHVQAACDKWIAGAPLKLGTTMVECGTKGPLTYNPRS